MKYLNNILAVLLALPYIVFGANFFFHFIPMPPMSGQAGEYVGILAMSNFLLIVKIMEIVFGLMLLANFKRALTLVLIAPISVNILLYELCIAHQPGIGVILVLLNAVLLYRYKNQYASMMK
jgi:putative oxidoreductase